MARHLVFYDGKCGLCDQAVQFIIKRDLKEQFVFAPLQGETANAMLPALPENIKKEDSLILIEDFKSQHTKIYILGNGALRICWLLGGAPAILGTLFWLPSWCVNWAYRIVAKNRHRLFSADRCVLPTKETQHRFLP